VTHSLIPFNKGYVLRNNRLGTVILPSEIYELLKKTQKILEHLEIAEKIDKRLKGHDSSENISWEKLKKKHGL
jgi:hypothetical protein